jgi:hypothetical protein
MRVRICRAAAWSLVVGAFIVVLISGCSRQCASLCTPSGPWQSPTIQATRSLLLVSTPELKILRVDGRNVHPSCTGKAGVHEYYIRPGKHELTAAFRYAAPVGAGLVGEAYGRPLKLTHTFETGHEYVAIYREHPYPTVEATSLGQVLAHTVFQPYEGTWSMRVIDLAEAEVDAEPEVLQAGIYTALIGASARADERSFSATRY